MWHKQQKNRRFRRGHVLDVKLRSDRARAARTRLAWASAIATGVTLLLLVLLCRGGEWALQKLVYQNSAFAIQVVLVQTDGSLGTAELQRWAGVKTGENLIALDLASVRRNLELVSAVKSVSVERILPHTLSIRVSERRPIAQVDVPHAGSGEVAVSVFELDADGWVIQPVEARLRTIPLSQIGSLPVITGLAVYQLQPGRRLTSASVTAALHLIGVFAHSPMAGIVDLRSVDVSAPDVVVATTSGGARVTFALDHVEEQLGRWREIYNLGLRLGRTIASLNLAVRNNVPVNWMEMNPGTAPKSNPPLWRKNV
ncbi:MAG: FtsQ-type POTRA domain-containing protein [Verrucomicrobia bacterium]|nr:FtsQ-type POTRA domain-containing protein [Verrucomicrobiota bacterium]MDE3099358.1 FtsQ-type POTRA domain-containing protein [Verrucomicrobiota bacterium]